MIAIAAMTRDRLIGVEGRLPWHLSGDLKFFKRTTTGHIVVMGRRTYESIGKPLPGRENWVVSRTASIEGVRVLRSPEDVLDPEDGRKIYVIGGAELYTALLAKTDELLITHVRGDFQGDTFFPAYEEAFDAGELLESGEGYEIRRHIRRSRLPAA